MSALVHIIPGACLLLFMWWNEIRRKNRRLLPLRLLASLLAVISILVLSFPDGIFKKTANGVKKIVLLTEGYEFDSVEKSFQKEDTATRFYATDQAIIGNRLSYPIKIWTILDSAEFKNAGVIRITGNGLTTSQLSLLHHAPVIFNSPSPTPGIVSVNWFKKLNFGERLLVQGTFQNPSAKQIEIYLSAFGRVLDSATIPANTSREFQLGTVPAFIGRSVFSLNAVVGKDTVQNGDLPVEVNRSPPLNLLVLASSPNFENKFLKNWLAEKGFGFAIRTTISRNKYAWQYLNRKERIPNSITSSFLDSFDVVISDARELAQINKKELDNFQKQIEHKGLGLIIRADTPSKSNAFFLQPFPFIPMINKTNPSLTLENADTINSRFSLPSTNNFSLRHQNGMKTWIAGNHDDIFAGSVLFGSGKMVMTTLANTYSLVLAGNEKAYANVWSALIQEVARSKPARASWKIIPEFIYPDQPASVILETTANGLVQPKINADTISMKQNAMLPFQWEGTYWPQHPGWQKMLLPPADTAWWYVYPSGSWKSVLTNEKIIATRQYALQHPGQDTLAAYPMPGFRWKMAILFFIFLGSCGFLWLEKKMGG